ncbi:Do family serine endopeptidase [Legionella septentrionalis]|uniref:Do family serine endopeptidase n=2 Tax=Legionellaceae TaxID=444 RepID=A0A3S1CLE4_9GAMM|nr:MULTISPECIES: Do family serine endopeptidase [Legionella]MCP0913609.1 Do family serine endopeptidase [Legionella sp. 27cVA30]RUQ88203.1 Do family serine endopeptidase [Legionella septentrionalis]RUQ95045.1 Do family serine endopeptidase [Legionella septentrionalis]RUR08795.1 Do family serine endopeptidase [Legionella septentrionalis]RUR15967.1 Do family serine endopeptidase [Legionella septentrionalis]
MLQKFRYAIALACMLANSWAQAAVEVNQLPTLAPVLKNAMPAIVNVAVQGIIPGNLQPQDQDDEDDNNQERQAGPEKPRKFQSIGSGVIIDPTNGIIITNDHVIRNATLITVTLNDGRRLKAKLIGGDSETDVAVLKIDAKNLKSLPIGDSDKIEVGDFVVAIGNPFGLNSFGNSQSATFGIVSAMKRSDLNIEGIENFIQTDAAINPGNSGGALVNAKGELIGINTAIISLYGGNVGIGFAIPINMAKDVAQQIIKYGSVHRGLMGIFVQHLTPELAQALDYPEDFQGALISQVNENSPAEIAGLQPGDIIVQINDTHITQATQVKTTISLLRVGSQAKIKIKRGGKDMTFDVMVTDVKKHEQQLQSKNPFLYGLALRDFEQDSPMHGHVQGVQVVGASENSAGWRAGLRPGDIIVAANKQPTVTTRDLQKIAQQKNKQLLVQVLRGAGALYILII